MENRNDIFQLVKNPQLSDREKIINVLLELGIATSAKGFSYIQVAVEYMKENQERPKMRDAYTAVAKQFNNTSLSQIERAIRHAVERGIQKGDTKLWYQIFKIDVKGKPTNCEFLSRLVLLLQEGI